MEHTTNNKKTLLECGHSWCIYCYKQVETSQIKDWIQDCAGHTAVCPHCFCDTLVSESLLPNNEKRRKEQLQRWHCEGFGGNMGELRFGKPTGSDKPSAERFGPRS